MNMNYIKKFMDDNGIEVNEEFYVINEEGEKIKNIYAGEYLIKFHFTENLEFKSELINLICDKVLLSLMLGECKIEKIPHKHKSVWDLKSGDDYYYIDMCGNVDRTTFGNGTYLTDKKMIEFGNAFLTREEAEHEVERRKCEAILLKYGTIDMVSFGHNCEKYFIYFNHVKSVIKIGSCCKTCDQGTIYFESEELVQKAINECGEDRLKKYVFNVKE